MKIALDPFSRNPDMSAYQYARYEHAWLLRAEGLTLDEVGSRFGVGGCRAAQMIKRFGKRVQRSIRRARIGFSE